MDIGQESASQDFGSKMRGWMSGETSDGVCLAIMKVLAISGGCNDKAEKEGQYQGTMNSRSRRKGHKFRSGGDIRPIGIG